MPSEECNIQITSSIEEEIFQEGPTDDGANVFKIRRDEEKGIFSVQLITWSTFPEYDFLELQEKMPHVMIWTLEVVET